MMVASVAMSIASFLAMIIGTVAGMVRTDFAFGIWPVVLATPLVGLPIAIVLLIALVIVSARRRSSEAAAAQARAPQKRQRPSPGR